MNFVCRFDPISKMCVYVCEREKETGRENKRENFLKSENKSLLFLIPSNFEIYLFLFYM